MKKRNDTYAMRVLFNLNATSLAFILIFGNDVLEVTETTDKTYLFLTVISFSLGLLFITAFEKRVNKKPSSKANKILLHTSLIYWILGIITYVAYLVKN